MYHNVVKLPARKKLETQPVEPEVLPESRQVLCVHGNGFLLVKQRGETSFGLPLESMIPQDIVPVACECLVSKGVSVNVFRYSTRKTLGQRFDSLRKMERMWVNGLGTLEEQFKSMPPADVIILKAVLPQLAKMSIAAG